MQRVRFLIIICLALGLCPPVPSSATAALERSSISPALPDATKIKPQPGVLLVARRALDDSFFGHSVIYLVEHDQNGSLGLIVNRPAKINLSEVLSDIDSERASIHRLYFGGPVDLARMLMLVHGAPESTAMQQVAGDVYVGSDRSILEAILAENKPPQEVRFFLGYSGWATGQLVSELERGSWHVVPADIGAIFSSDTDPMWDRLIERLEPPGIEVNDRRIPPAIAFTDFPNR